MAKFPAGSCDGEAPVSHGGSKTSLGNIFLPFQSFLSDLDEFVRGSPSWVSSFRVF